MGGRFGIEPQAVAHDIDIGNRLQRLGGAYKNIATDHHRAQALGRGFHHLLVERNLKREKILRKALSALPTKHGNRRENLSRRRIRRQPTTQAASVKQNSFLGGEPIGKRRAVDAGLQKGVGLLQQPSRSTARTEFLTDGVVRTKPFLTRMAGNVVKTLHKIGRKRKQFFHFFFLLNRNHPLPKTASNNSSEAA